MIHPPCLEDFSSLLQVGEPEEATADLAEEQRLEEYEKGYRAGWDACTETDSHQLSKAAQSANERLCELSFNFEEASSAILYGLKPLFKQITDHIVPKTLQTTFGHHLETMLLKCAQDALDKGVVIRSHPDSAPFLETALQRTPTLSAILEPDQSIPPGQIFIAGPEAEILVDQSRLTQELQNALAPLTSQFIKGDDND